MIYIVIFKDGLIEKYLSAYKVNTEPSAFSVKKSELPIRYMVAKNCFYDGLFFLNNDAYELWLLEGFCPLYKPKILKESNEHQFITLQLFHNYFIRENKKLINI